MKTKFFLSKWLTGLFFLMSFTLVQAQTVIEVTDAGDNGGAGQFRAAINQVNASSGASIIRFKIATPATGAINIDLGTVLPLIRKTVWIDGTSQAGYVKGNPRINIRGAGTVSGIFFNRVSGCKLLGVVVSGFKEGVWIKLSDNTEVRDCIINNCKEKNLIIETSSYCVIKGNMINTDRFGACLFPPSNMTANATEGIYFTNNDTTGSKYNIIGGTECGEGNTVAFVTSEGIDNYTGLMPDGVTDKPTTALNIGNTISGNSIYFNRFQGIWLRASNANIQAPTITLPAGCVTTGTSATPYGIIEVFSGMSSNEVNPWLVQDPSNKKYKKNARTLLGTTKADVNGAWSITLGYIPLDSITATVTDPVTGGTSALAAARYIVPTTVNINWSPQGGEIPICLGKEITFTATSSGCPNMKFLWDFGDGSPLTEASTPVHLYAAQGNYTVKIYAAGATKCAASVQVGTIGIYIGAPCPPPCASCIGSFAPEVGDYIYSVWVKKEISTPADLSYDTPAMYVTFPGSTGGTQSWAAFPTGQIIDGWQRIEGRFTIPPSPAYVPSIKVELFCGADAGNSNCLFDDLRIFPVNGSMKTYVYDPVTLRLVAELDERNYSTFYEYDEEGKLIRVKKETEKGIMTLKENRNSSTKR